MLSAETLDSYRRMTPAQRLRLTFSIMDESEPYLLLGSSTLVARKIQRINEQNDERNASMRLQMARSRRTHDE